MFEMRLNSTRLKNLVVTKNLKISRVIIKMGLMGGKEKGERGTLDGTTNGGITFTRTFNLSELRISERISFSLASLTE